MGGARGPSLRAGCSCRGEKPVTTQLRREIQATESPELPSRPASLRLSHPRPSAASYPVYRVPGDPKRPLLLPEPPGPSAAHLWESGGGRALGNLWRRGARSRAPLQPLCAAWDLWAEPWVALKGLSVPCRLLR